MKLYELLTVFLGEVNLMGPLIDAELEKVDRKHAQLTQLSADLVEALTLYHSLMREPSFNPMDKMMYNFPQTATPMVGHITLLQFQSNFFYQRNMKSSISCLF